jgi:hypoxanthine phosphoribosyltransferase
MDISTDDFFKAVACIHRQIRSSENTFDYVVGVSRGGLIPGVVLSHRLEVPFRPIEWSLRDSHKKYIPPDIIQDVWGGKKILLVEDIVDSGETIVTIKNRFGDSSTNVKVACLIYNKGQDLVVPDYWFNAIDRNEYKDWVNFWWENK